MNGWFGAGLVMFGLAIALFLQGHVFVGWLCVIAECLCFINSFDEGR